MDRKRNRRTNSGTNCYRAQRNIASLSAIDCRAAYSTSIDNQRVGKAIDIWCRSNQRCAIKTCDVRLQSIVCGVVALAFEADRVNRPAAQQVLERVRELDFAARAGVHALDRMEDLRRQHVAPDNGQVRGASA